MQTRLFVLVLCASVLSVCPAVSQAQDIGLGEYYCIDSPPRSAVNQAVYLVYYLYAHGPAPEPVAFAGNADCLGGVDLLDVIYLVNFALRGGPAPCGVCGWYVDPSNSRDAETIAMWYAREVIAPESLLTRLQSDLVRLRTLPGASQTALTSIHFEPRWLLSRIGLMVDSGTYVAMQEGQYHDWDSPNLRYEAERIEFDHPYPGSPFFVHIYFAGIKNSVVLADLYADLPAVEGAWVYLRISAGGNPPPTSIYPLMHGDTATYLFRISWEFTGIWRHHRYWYAAALPDTAWMIGDWDPRVNPEEPFWWSRAVANVEHYWED